jgi:hypothetical protein
MKPGDSPHNLNTKSIPELIKQLWELYMVMSLDPVLASSADHIKQAALSLEHTRLLAFQVSQDAARQQSRRLRRRQRRPDATATAQQAPAEDVDLAWLRLAKAGSQLKH